MYENKKKKKIMEIAAFSNTTLVHKIYRITLLWNGDDNAMFTFISDSVTIVTKDWMRTKDT